MMNVSLPPSLEDFARDYANFDSLRCVCITLDVDFVPDYMIENVLDILTRFEAPATIFATHESACLKRLDGDPRFEIGTHPNLAPGSTQGSDLTAIVNELREWYPSAVGNRFHVLHYGYRDLRTLSEIGFTYDVSTLHFNAACLLPAWHRDLQMTLLSYFWEDGLCEDSGLPMRRESIDLASAGMKVINFHPLNVFLNAPDSRQRLKFLSETDDLTNCPHDVAERYRMSGEGSAAVLVELLEHVTQRGCRLVQMGELVSAFRGAVAGDEA